MSIETIAIFPGSFDPFTKGHLDLARRGLSLFDRLFIAIGENEEKISKRSASTDRKIAEVMAVLEKSSLLSDVKSGRVVVVSYSGKTIDYARKIGAGFLIRGIRDEKDFKDELFISAVNSSLSRDTIKTVFLLANPQFSDISSTNIRNSALN
jgi:pantetheine-phosphate adenylyltransferase